MALNRKDHEILVGIYEPSTISRVDGLLILMVFGLTYRDIYFSGQIDL